MLLIDLPFGLVFGNIYRLWDCYTYKLSCIHTRPSIKLCFMKVIGFCICFNYFRELLIQVCVHFGGCSLWCCWIVLCYWHVFLLFSPFQSVRLGQITVTETETLCVNFNTVQQHHKLHSPKWSYRWIATSLKLFQHKLNIIITMKGDLLQDFCITLL